MEGTRKPTNWRGSAKRDITLHSNCRTHIILASTYSENVRAWPCIDSHGRVDHDNSTTPAIHAMHGSITTITRKSQSATYVTRKRRYPLENPFFRGQGAKCLTGYRRGNEPLETNHSFQNCKLFQNRLNYYREIVTRTWPKMKTFMRFVADWK